MKIFVDMLHKKSEQQVINKQNSKIIDIFLVCIFFVKTEWKNAIILLLDLNKRPEKDFRVRFHKNCKLENYSTLSNCKTIQNQSFVVDSLFI